MFTILFVDYIWELGRLRIRLLLAPVLITGVRFWVVGKLYAAYDWDTIKLDLLGLSRWPYFKRLKNEGKIFDSTMTGFFIPFLFLFILMLLKNFIGKKFLVDDFFADDWI